MKYLPCLMWIPLAIAKVLLALAGLVMVPIGLMTRYMSFGPIPEHHWPNNIFWLWGNDEEGVPDWWLGRAADGEYGKLASWFPRFWWLAIRNPVNNSRFLFKDTKDYGMVTNWGLVEPMEAPQMVNLNRRMAFAYRWSGWKSGYRRVWLGKKSGKYSEVWIGFKLGSSVPGLGFAMQLRLNREIGK